MSINNSLSIVARRVREESKFKGCTGLDHSHLHIPMEFEFNYSEGQPEMMFYVWRDNQVAVVAMHLTEDLLEGISEGDAAIWQGVLEFVEDDLLKRQ